MKVLLIHNYYKYSGGEDEVLKNENNILSNNGHIVKIYAVDNKVNIKSLFDKIKLIFNVNYNKKSLNDLFSYLLEFKPDIVHVHNFFPLLSPSIYDACLRLNIPVIQTLHNYRIIYPNGYLYHNGKIDERSINGSAYSCVIDGVYRNSIIQTFVVAKMIEYHRKKNTWNMKVGKFIALTDFAKVKFIQAGIQESKIVVKPNFVDDKTHQRYIDKRYYINYLFVGRISEEKGILELLRTWTNQKIKYVLNVLGTGPLYKEASTLVKDYDNINMLGHLSKDEVSKYLSNATALIFPSKWYEGFPMTIVEAFSIGIPVITSNIGSHASIIKDNYNGLHYKLGDDFDLKEKITKLAENNDLRDELGGNARKTYLSKYTPEKNYQELIDIYQKAIEEKNN